MPSENRPAIVAKSILTISTLLLTLFLFPAKGIDNICLFILAGVICCVVMGVAYYYIEIKGCYKDKKAFDWLLSITSGILIITILLNSSVLSSLIDSVKGSIMGQYIDSPFILIPATLIVTIFSITNSLFSIIDYVEYLSKKLKKTNNKKEENNPIEITVKATIYKTIKK